MCQRAVVVVPNPNPNKCNSPVEPSGLDRLISGDRLTSLYSDRLVEGPLLLL